MKPFGLLPGVLGVAVISLAAISQPCPVPFPVLRDVRHLFPHLAVQSADSVDRLPSRFDAPLPGSAMRAALMGLDAGWEATVHVLVVIDTSGAVLWARSSRLDMQPKSGHRTVSPRREIHLRSDEAERRALAHDAFKRAAEQIAAVSRFVPGELDGQPVAVLVCVVERFISDAPPQ